MEDHQQVAAGLPGGGEGHRAVDAEVQAVAALQVERLLAVIHPLENAALGDEELLEILDGVGLGAFVRGHPLGLDMPIQGNASLSGGQRQAVGLARVLLQDPPILLLDEPTAAFDQGSEKQVIDYLQQWLGKRTLVITTHKKSMLALVERAVVLRQGRVIMDGPLEQVVQGNQVQAPQAAEGGNHGL